MRLAILLLYLSACSSYVDRMHRQIDRDQARHEQRRLSQLNFQQSKMNQKKDMVNKNSPMLSSEEAKVVVPSIKRKYISSSRAKRRYSDNDLNDNSNGGSLWIGSGRGHYLFASNTKKISGDIVLVNIQGKMKNEMTLELKRAFPKDPFEEEGTKKAKSGDAAAAPAKAEGSNTKSGSDAEAVHDRLSCVVVEEINQEHLLLRGRKGLLYEERKRFVEVSALVSRKDIRDDNSVNSNSILELNIKVLRY
ncbi:MAG: flagellar basal body L-ring protein FlgH [Bacteriovoracaceae bacterium]|nr:flagellar basal body L-ring protein FlgH [Bacteriovoracaceae bacterium]